MIPRVTYTKEETETWGVVYRTLKDLFPTHACSQFNHIFPLLEQNCGYSDKNIPQLQDISEYLHSKEVFQCLDSQSMFKKIHSGILDLKW